MVDILKTIVILLSLVIVIVPCFLIKSLNTKKNVRCKQLRYPVIAAVFSVVTVILFSLIGKLMNWLTNLEFVQKFLNWLSPQGKFDYVVLLYTAIVINALILFAFFVVKGMARICINKKKIPSDDEELTGIRKIYWKIVSVFYDIEAGKAVPQKKWIKIYHTLKYASWIITVLYLSLMVFLQFPVFMSYSWIPYSFMESCLKTLYLWPIISLILINEFKWFLEGKEKFAKPSKMVFDHSELHNVSDYGELAEQYKLQFPERFGSYIVGSAKGGASNFYNDVRPETKLEEAIAEQLRERDYTINASFLSCIKQLAKGKNALIDASIFSDFGEYLFVYLNTLLAHGDNVLFLCSDDESADNYGKYISDKFKAVNNYHRVWIVKDNSGIHGLSDADILVLTPQVVLDDNAFIGQNKFFSKLSTVIMVNTAEVIAKDGIVLALLAHKLTNMIQNDSETRALRYICLSESVPPETSNALKQILNLQEDLYVCDGYQSFDNTHFMLWNYESGKAKASDDPGFVDDGKSTLAQDNLFGDNNSQTYWGVSLPIACVGMKYMVKKITIVSHSGTPYMQILNSMKNQINRLSDYFGSEIGFSDFDNSILINRVDSEDTHTAFIVVEDDLCNLPLAIYNYCRFGGTDTTMIHIISKPYMLRDYFTANAEKYINNESKINMIMPALSDTKQIVVTKLLCEALDGGVEENDFYQRIKILDPSVQDIEQALETCCDIIFPERNGAPIEYYFSFKKESRFNTNTVDYDNKTFIRLKLDTPLAVLLQNSKQAKMELRGRQFNIGVFAEHLHQYFVPTQSFACRGNLYTIERIDSNEGVVYVREASDRLNSPVDYVQVRTYEIKESAHIVDLIPVPYETNDKRLSNGYEIALYKHAKISVDTIGYYALNAVNGKLDLCNGPSFKPMSEDDITNSHRDYNDANMVSFKIKGVGADKADKTAFLLAVMMNEMMKTIFPYSHKCISVCPVLTNQDSISCDPMGSKIKNAYPQVIVGNEYAHDPNDVEVLIIEDSISDVGMIKTLLQDEQYPFAMFFETITSYLTWFNTFEEEGNISKNYLFFGAEEMPSCFDVDTLTGVCSEFETIKRRGAIKVERVTSKGQCSYCHRDLFNVEYTEIKDNAGKNNRKLCSKCAKLLVSDENELKKLYKKVRKYLCDSFAIELPDDINVRFATAEKIRKKLKTGDQRVVVGFADPKTRELWVEADAPAPNVQDVLVHELTHMWQFDNIKMSDLVYVEGHASYVEVQYMRHENRKSFAEWQNESLNSRQDEYGEGFRRLKAELEARGDFNSFSYMLELFGDGGSGRPPHGGDYPPAGGDDESGDADDDINVEDAEDDKGEISRTPDSCPKYAFNLLPENMKNAYNLLKNGIMAFEAEVSLESSNLTLEDVFKVIEYIRRDSPEIFWLGNNTVMSNPSTNVATSVKFDYCMTKATAISRQKKIDESLRPFFESVNGQMSDYAVVKKIYENIIGLVDYDSLGLEESKNAPQGNKPDDLRSIYGVFVKKKAVCAGYAVATQYLLNRVGVECAYIRGDTTEGYHAWNLLRLEGDYYYIDTTWGDRSNTDKSKSREGMNYDYFCITTKELLIDHTPDADFPVPDCTATKCNYHVRNGLFLNEYSVETLKRIIFKHVEQGNLYVSLKFADEELYNTAYKAIIDAGDLNRVIEDAVSHKKRVATGFSYVEVKEKLKLDLYLKKA